MGYWTRFFNWCRRPDMIKIRQSNPSIVEKRMRISPLQIGSSIVIGWVVLFVSNFVIQSIVHPGGEEVFWGLLVLGLSLIGLGFIGKERIINIHRAKTLLQIGIVIAIIWVMILFWGEGPYRLGLPQPYIITGHTPDGTPIFTSIIVLMLFLGFPALGSILVASGIILKSINRSKSRKTTNSVVMEES
jgi:hypothetical protein